MEERKQEAVSGLKGIRKSEIMREMDELVSGAFSFI